MPHPVYHVIYSLCDRRWRQLRWIVWNSQKDWISQWRHSLTRCRNRANDFLLYRLCTPRARLAVTATRKELRP